MLDDPEIEAKPLNGQKVNPFFPPERLKDEIKANFDSLLENYPSGMEVNSLLAAKNFKVHRENIIPGNGAAELIKSLMEKFITGPTGFIRPMFEEYPNRYSENNSVIFNSSSLDYRYTADDVINFFGDKDISTLVIINPDNPSGNYLPHADVLKLLKWTKESAIKLVVDESFADFADEKENTLFIQSIFLEPIIAFKHTFT